VPATGAAVVPATGAARSAGDGSRRSAGDPVRAVCVSSLGETVVPVTGDRQILGPALLNFDGRGRAISRWTARA